MVEPAAQLGRSLRGHRDATRLSLAARSGVSKASLSMIEAGAANSSLETLWRLAGALGVSLGTLLGESDPPRTRLIRAGAGAPLASESESGLTGRLLLTEGRPYRTEMIEFELPAGADYESNPHQAGTEDFLFCVSGRIEVGPWGQRKSCGRATRSGSPPICRIAIAARRARAACSRSATRCEGRL